MTFEAGHALRRRLLLFPGMERRESGIVESVTSPAPYSLLPILHSPFPIPVPMPNLKQQLIEDMKIAMKGGDKARLGVIRLVNAAIKQREVDERIELDDAAVIAVMEKMVKQRRDSIGQYEAAGREDLAAIERAELVVIETYLPEKMGEDEILREVQAAMVSTGAAGPADIGKLMGALKPKLAGKADMAQVSALVRKALAG